MSVYRATRLDHAEKINRVSLYIAEHIGEPLELRVIARVGGFSPYHFHRVFLAAVGETVGDHIRRLRLRHAAKELVSSPSSITRIAFDAGFESSAAFSKAFRKGFGMTPTQFRLNGKWVASIDSLTLRRRPSIQPEMCYVPSKTIYYIRASGVGDGSYCNVAPKAYDALWKYLASTGLSDEVEELVGTVPHDLALAAERNVLYDAGVVFRRNVRLPLSKQGREPPVPIRIHRFPAMRCAVFRHEGPYETLWQTWNAIYRNWFPSCGEELLDHFPFEIYLKDKRTTPSRDLITNIHIPLLQ
jgi:AraC family transcriptional regulator